MTAKTQPVKTWHLANPRDGVTAASITVDGLDRHYLYVESDSIPPWSCWFGSKRAAENAFVRNFGGKCTGRNKWREVKKGGDTCSDCGRRLPSGWSIQDDGLYCLLCDRKREFKQSLRDSV